MVATDSQSVIIYHKEGKVVGVRQHNSQLPIETDGTEIVIVDTIDSSGLDLKVMIKNILVVSIQKCFYSSILLIFKDFHSD